MKILSYNEYALSKANTKFPQANKICNNIQIGDDHQANQKKQENKKSVLNVVSQGNKSIRCQSHCQKT